MEELEKLYPKQDDPDGPLLLVIAMDGKSWTEKYTCRQTMPADDKKKLLKFFVACRRFVWGRPLIITPWGDFGVLIQAEA